MGFWGWLSSKLGFKDSAFERLFLSVYGGASTASGESVNPTSAMQCAAVFACVNVISETVAMLPLFLYKRAGDAVAKDPKHPLFRILHSRPNPWQTSFEWRQMTMAHILLRGNSFSFINRAGAKRKETVRELIPIHPDNVTIDVSDDNVITYTVRTRAGKSAKFAQGEILHLRGLSLDGFNGITPITYGRESIGLALAAEKHGGRLFGNGARPSGVLTTPNPLKEETAKLLRTQWEEANGGENQNRVAVLHSGLDFKPLSMNSNDAQFLETRKYQRSEIASLFRVPAHMINDLEKATFSNIEHLGMAFVIHTIQPWLVRLEQAFARDLLREDEQSDFFAEFLISGLMRGDQKSRYDAYAIGRNWGWLSANDIRRLENMNPIPKGDEYLSPLNMVPAGTKPKPQEVPTNAGEQTT